MSGEQQQPTVGISIQAQFFWGAPLPRRVPPKHGTTTITEKGLLASLNRGMGDKRIPGCQYGRYFPEEQRAQQGWNLSG